MKNNPNKGEISNFNKLAKQLFPNWQAQQISLLTEQPCCDNVITDVVYDCDTNEYVVTIEKPIRSTDGPCFPLAFLIGFPKNGDPAEIVAGPLYTLSGKTLRFPGILRTGDFIFVVFAVYSAPIGFNITTNKTLSVVENLSSDFDSAITIPACP